jgi:hypothetical protein
MLGVHYFEFVDSGYDDVEREFRFVDNPEEFFIKAELQL